MRTRIIIIRRSRIKEKDKPKEKYNDLGIIFDHAVQKDTFLRCVL